MTPEARRIPPNDAEVPARAGSVLRVLEFVDELPPRATGALRFGDRGIILVESGKICWAVADTMRRRLTDILRHQHTPPLPRQAVEEVYRRCKAERRPLGEELVASGLVSEAGLRAALFEHAGEAVSYLARIDAVPDAFIDHPHAGYDPSFSFSSTEILASLGGADDPARATRARGELTATLVAESTGAGFVRRGTSGSAIIAVDRACDLPVVGLSEICNWASKLFDFVTAFDPTTTVARAVWCERTAVVAWRLGEIGFVGLCSSRAAAARLVSQVTRRTRPSLLGGAAAPPEAGSVGT